MAFSTLALITDYGERDGFVGAIKGSLYRLLQQASINPLPPIVDISHQIHPQNVWQGAWVLENVYNDFPEFSIFVCIVDPKIGESLTRNVLCHWPAKNLFFIAPDNGILTPIILASNGALKAYTLETPEHDQFHGRDVFAPAAASLVKALSESSETSFLSTLGPEVNNLKKLEWYQPNRHQDDFVEGQIFHSDVYGNLVTNIPSAWLSPGQIVELKFRGQSWQAHYPSAETQSLNGAEKIYLSPSSGGTLELTAFKQSAKQLLGANVGDPVILKY